MIKFKKHKLYIIWSIIIALPLIVYAINTVSTGYKSTPSSTHTIDAHGVCKNVTNNSSISYFVSTKSSGEWSAFRNNLPSGVSLSDCCVSHDHIICNGDWEECWYDSCGNQEECSSYNCPHYYRGCIGPGMGPEIWTCTDTICGANWECTCSPCGHYVCHPGHSGCDWVYYASCSCGKMFCLEEVCP